MRTIRFLLQKEFLQIFRNKGMLPIMFVMPFIQLLILSNAATFDVKNVQFHLVDKDRSHLSMLLTKHFESSEYFTMGSESIIDRMGIDQLMGKETKMMLVIPHNFERDLYTTGKTAVQFVVVAEDGFFAGVVQGYVTEVLGNFNKELPDLLGLRNSAQIQLSLVPEIHVLQANWYNPELEYKHYMVPGILVILVTLIGLFLSGMNVVREKEIGTIDQINVTPIKRYQFIVGKLLPFWVIGLAELTLGLVIAKLVFSVPMLGSYFLIYFVASVYLLVVLGMGLLISTVTETQQQAMFIAWFFMVIFTLMSGLFTAIESMPKWAQTITLFNPVRYFVDIMRRVMLKGSGLVEIRNQLLALTAYALVMISLAVNRYRKVSS
ncbi:MAG: ABC transporter permease [Chlorobiales bacterium]|nr:ABC transporter permease [Chlorobiales bacterium]